MKDKRIFIYIFILIGSAYLLFRQITTDSFSIPGGPIMRISRSEDPLWFGIMLIFYLAAFFITLAYLIKNKKRYFDK